ncbi:MAG TPA: hypothetical protein PLY87_06015, partial [Planctomycetaceae bacterium]|nr:hypothetical protein [Planctomycetaceae bacterium]HQZ64609.1 hypothetical protein [Planctomycetaceae bacterium]
GSSDLFLDRDLALQRAVVCFKRHLHENLSNCGIIALREIALREVEIRRGNALAGEREDSANS